MLGVYYMNKSGDILWKSKADLLGCTPEVYFHHKDVLAFWPIPDKMPGGTIEEGKKFCLGVLGEMIDLGAKYEAAKHVAENGFSIPVQVFNAVYQAVRERKEANAN